MFRWAVRLTPISSVTRAVNLTKVKSIRRLDFSLWAERKRGKNQLVKEYNRIWFYSIYDPVYFYPYKSLIYIDISEI